MGFIDGGGADKSRKVRGTTGGEQMKLSKENENFRENYLQTRENGKRRWIFLFNSRIDKLFRIYLEGIKEESSSSLIEQEDWDENWASARDFS